MALDTAQGSFDVTGGVTGDITVSGLNFQPKVIIFYGNQNTAGGGPSNDNGFFFGTADDALNERAMSFYSRNNVATSDNGGGRTATRSLYFIDYAINNLLLGNLTSVGPSGFTVNIAFAAANYKVNYLALGGTDLTNYRVGEFTDNVGNPGPIAVTGVGFQPDAVLMFAPSDSTTTIAQNTFPYNLCFGYMDASGDQGYIAGWVQHNVNPSVAQRRQRTDKCFGLVGVGGLRLECSFTSMDSDGFTINGDTVIATSRTIYYIALKGIGIRGTSFSIPASTGVVSYPVSPLIPKANLFFSFGSPTNSGTLNDQTFNFGATDGTNSSACTAISLNGISPTNCMSRLTFTNNPVVSWVVPGGTFNCIASLNAYGTSKFDLNWTNVSANADEFFTMVLGERTRLNILQGNILSGNLL